MSSENDQKKEKEQNKTSQNSPKTNEQAPAMGRPILDLRFQMGLLKLALEQDHYCTQLIKYLADDQDTRNQQKFIFAQENLTKLFLVIASCYKEFGTRPEIGTLRQKISEMKKVNEKEALYATLEQVMSVDVFNDLYYKQFLTTFIKQVKMAQAVVKVKNLFTDRPDDSFQYMQAVLDDINKVSFEEDDIVTLEDIPELLIASGKNNKTKIPTGIKELDEDLLGGLPIESLVTVVGGTNVGKSIACISLACSALRAKNEDGTNKGLKVLHVNLEGMRDEAIMRYTANLAGVNFRDLLQQTYSEDDYKRIKKAMDEYGPDRLKVRNMLGFGATIEELAAICREEYKTFKFDVLLVDYGQLLETQQKGLDHRFIMAKVHRGLDTIAKELSCVCITPVQATRGAQRDQNEFKRKTTDDESQAPVLRSEDISEAFEIARVSAVIITLNITDEEREKGQMRWFLEKQRQGVKGKTYGLYTNFAQMNQITGKYFNPRSVVAEGEDPTGLDTQNETFTIPSLVEEGGSEESSGQREQVDITVKQFLDKKVEYHETKEKYNQAKEDEDYDSCEKLEEKCDLLRTQMGDILAKAQKEFSAAHPDATVEDLEKMKEELREMRSKGKNPKEIEELEMKVNRFNLGLGNMKVPV